MTKFLADNNEITLTLHGGGLVAAVVMVIAVAVAFAVCG